MKKIVFNNSNSFQFAFMKTKNFIKEKFFVFIKISFLKPNRFQMFQKIFRVFQPFYEIPKRPEKQFCSRFKIQNAYQNAYHSQKWKR